MTRKADKGKVCDADSPQTQTTMLSPLTCNIPFAFGMHTEHQRGQHAATERYGHETLS